MNYKYTSDSLPHNLPDDMKDALMADKEALRLWGLLTPLARNEWICWVISPKKTETRVGHIARLIAELKEVKRRPCCWIGCIHRNDKEISPSIAGIIGSRKSAK